LKKLNILIKYFTCCCHSLAATCKI